MGGWRDGGEASALARIQQREWWVQQESLCSPSPRYGALSISGETVGVSVRALSGWERGQGHGHTLLLSIPSYLTLAFMIRQSRPQRAYQSCNDRSESTSRRSHFQSVSYVAVCTAGVFLLNPLMCAVSHVRGHSWWWFAVKYFHKLMSS